MYAHSHLSIIYSMWFKYVYNCVYVISFLEFLFVLLIR